MYWYNGTAWALASNQTYDPSTHCVTITVNSTTVPTLSQLTGTRIAAGSPPTITAVAKTADGKPVHLGRLDESIRHGHVHVYRERHANGPGDARERRSRTSPRRGTCTDGVGQKATTTFTGINVDKTPPTCSITVSPTVLWPANSKPVAITGTVTVGDNLSGIASVVGGTITSNEALGSGDVQGLTVNATYTSPLKLSAVLNLTGTLVAKRAGGGSGRIYSQTVTVTDQAGNTNAAPCTWTVTVPHDRGSGVQVVQSTGEPSASTPALTATITARAGCGSIDHIQFGELGKSFDNAQVSVASPSGGPNGQTTGFTYDAASRYGVGVSHDPASRADWWGDGEPCSFVRRLRRVADVRGRRPGRLPLTHEAQGRAERVLSATASTKGRPTGVDRPFV